MRSTFVVTLVVAAAAGCASRDRPAAREPVSATRTTSLAVTTMHGDSTPVAGAPAASGGEQAASRERPADREISHAIRHALSRDAFLEDIDLERVRIHSSNGHVTLRGHVPTLADVSEIEMVARQTPGVVGVTNELSPTNK